MWAEHRRPGTHAQLVTRGVPCSLYEIPVPFLRGGACKLLIFSSVEILKNAFKKHSLMRKSNVTRM